MCTFKDYIGDLFNAQNFDQSFLALSTYCHLLGYSNISYSFTPPLALINKELPPIFASSKTINYQIDKYYLNHRLNSSTNNKNNHFTLYMLSTSQTKGVAILNILLNDNNRPPKPLTQSNHTNIKKASKIFHNYIVSNNYSSFLFLKGLLNRLNSTEINTLKLLLKGKNTTSIAKKLSKKQGYIENVSIKIRKRLGGIDENDKANISTRDLLYHFGLLGLSSNNI